MNNPIRSSAVRVTVVFLGIAFEQRPYHMSLGS